MFNTLSKINLLSRSPSVKFLINTSSNRFISQHGLKSFKNAVPFKSHLKFKPIVLLVSGAGIGAAGVCITTDCFKLGQSEWFSKLSECLQLISSRIFKVASCEAAVSKKAKLTRHEDETPKEEDSEKKEKLADDAFDWYEFYKLIKEEKFYFFAAICSAFIVALLNIQIPQDLGVLINSIYKMIQSNVKEGIETLYKPALSLVNLYLLQSFFTFSYIYLLGVMGENMAASLKKQLFSKLIKQDISFYDQKRAGELIDRLTTDIQDFKSSFKMCISQGLKSATQIVGCCVSLWLISPKLTIITSTVIPLAIGVGAFFGSILRKFSRKAQTQIAKSTGIADEAINNVRTVRAFAMEDAEIEMFGEEIDKAKVLNMKLSVGIGIFQGLSNLFINGVVLGVLFFSGNMLINQEINAGQMMAYLSATQMIQRSFAQISILFGQVIRGINSGGRVFEYLKLESVIPIDDVGLKLDDLKGTVEFTNVKFTYPNRQEVTVLDDFNMSVKPGQIIAIVGHSGSGKSTVCSLLERFYDPDFGQIKIDGVDIKELSPHWLRSKAIGYISQEPVLFATSIAENIKYGKSDATEEEIIAAAKLANAHDFISTFPKQYETRIGERGTTLSGGQKQRIAITRALLKKPKILILDEATSALDSNSERLVQETINKVIKSHTVIVVAHRLSTIQNADQIVVLQNGKIKEVGTHRELMKRQGHYYNLFNIQDTGAQLN